MSKKPTPQSESVIVSPLDFTSEKAPVAKGVTDALDVIELMVQHTTPEVRATVRNEVKKIREVLKGE